MDFAALIQGEINKKKASSRDYGCKATAPKAASAPPAAPEASNDDLVRLQRLKQLKRQREEAREEERREEEEARKEEERLADSKRQRLEAADDKSDTNDKAGAGESAISAEDEILNQAKLDAATDVRIKWDDVASKTPDTETTNRLYSQLRIYLGMLLSEWENTLLETKDKEETVDGLPVKKSKNAIFQETQLSLSSLMALLRQQGLQQEVLVMLSKVMYHLQRLEHHQAYDVYLKLCIGNACWPVGVASIGIHARASQNKTIASARDSKQVAHIVNDDTREWLVCIKRLLTFAEGYPERVRVLERATTAA